MAENYETTRTVGIELDGLNYEGTFRIMSGSVIVYFRDEIKFAQYGMNRPEVVARWLLTDICRKAELRKRDVARVRSQ